MTTYGQSDAVAVELAAALNTASAAGEFVLTLEAERLFARKLEPADIADYHHPVTVQVIPGEEMGDSNNRLDHVYDDTYGCHALILQHIVDGIKEGPNEERMRDLLRLRSEIIEYICARRLSCPDAVHPFEGASVVAHRHGREGIYDLNRLEESNVFYSDLIITYRVPGLRRSAG